VAFASSTSGATVLGSMRRTWGTFSNGSTDSGGTINPGVSNIVNFNILPTSHLGTDVPKATVTDKIVGDNAAASSVVIVTSDGMDGNWTCDGYGGG